MEISIFNCTFTIQSQNINMGKNKTTKNEYFIPELEDIRLGYEFEIKVFNEDLWVKIIMNTPNFTTILNKEEETYSMPDIIRVSYLTKEQIITEGWREIHYREYLSPDNKIHFFNGLKESDEDEEYKSTFSRYNGGYNNILFSGSCKDINTFRQILKNIK